MDATTTRARDPALREKAVKMARSAIVSAALLVAVMQPASALGDADPASDVLLAQSAYYPYQPTVSKGLEATLNKLLSSAGGSNRALKVAVIGSTGDLGGVPSFFGHPQAYAQFLDREISFNDRPPLLVVMPAGFGVVAAGPAKALAAIKIDSRHGSDGLVRAAIAGAAVLLHETGPALAVTTVPAAASGGGGPPTGVLFAAPGGLLLLLGLVAFLRARGDRRRRPAERE